MDRKKGQADLWVSDGRDQVYNSQRNVDIDSQNPEQHHQTPKQLISLFTTPVNRYRLRSLLNQESIIFN
jgi:hypothetical protein